MKKFRKVIFWLHLSSGVVAGIVIFIMSVTGALLAFEKNIIEFAEREMRVIAVPSENAQRLPIGEIIGRVREARSDSNPSNITLQNEADAAALVALGGGKQVF